MVGRLAVAVAFLLRAPIPVGGVQRAPRWPGRIYVAPEASKVQRVKSIGTNPRNHAAEGDERDLEMTDDAVFYLDALRLAMVGAADEAAFVECAQRILNMAPQGPSDSTEGPAILIRAIREAAMSLSANAPAGIGQ